MVKYRIYFCLNGRKNKYVSVYEFTDKYEWECAYESLPYDIIDDDDYNIWFDFGDE
jgi:hypothetical protein